MSMISTQSTNAPIRHPPQAGVAVRIRNLSKVFGKRTVLQNFSLEIAPGEFVAVVGRSGCGKSTLLRLLAGLETPSHGEVQLNDVPLLGLNPQARVMFQDSRLLPWRTVIDNVALGLQKHARAQSYWALEQVGLSDRAQEWTTVLSGGQKQRVALARALVTQPRLLLLDEPLGALDALTRLDMQQTIEALWQQQEFTALLVTHDVEEAVTLADRVIVIQNGQIDLNLPIHLPRSRNSGDPEFAHLKQLILNHILRKPSA